METRGKTLICKTILFLTMIFISIFFLLQAEAAVMGVSKIAGEISSVDLKSQQMTLITADQKELIFEFDRYVRVLTVSGKSGAPTDIKTGNKAEISYVVQGGKNMAATIRLR